MTTAQELIDGAFEEIEYDVQDMGGTPMATGVLGVNVDVTDGNREAIIEDAVKYINDKYALDIDESALDLSGLDEGEIAFLKESPLEVVASVNFPIIEVTAQNVKKK